ncbi:TRAP transporter substrate-binding protein DctP [Nocardia sp. NPDC050799]|uniref:TRAP transporter substrate-binding protein n=1 Tax=Nocardia sp. NPDC050799 TaxID=3154842 RepID=UPI0034103887
MPLSTQADRPRRRPSRAGIRYTLGSAAGVAVLLAATACAGASGGGGGGESVAAGASKPEFVAALADMDPVEMKVQVLTPQNTGYARAWEDYGKALDEWSGGKITFKMHYSGAITQTGIEDALADGLIDAAPFGPSAAPDKFPIAAWTTERMVFNENTPIAGTLQQVASVMQVGFDDPAIRGEIEDYGIHPLVPTVVNGSQNLFCGRASGNSLSDLKGKQIRTSTPAAQQEIEALGATSVSLPTLEVFEGLQRGTVDCLATAHTLAYAINLAEVTDYSVVDPMVGLAPTSEVPAVSKATWDELPLAAQQLMHDRLDVFLRTYLQEHNMGGIAMSMQQAVDNGVTVESFETDARVRLQDFHQQVLRKDDAPAGYDGGGFIENMRVANDAWATKVADLGYSNKVTWQEFAAHQKKEPVDVGPLVEELTTTVLDKHRPE